MRLPGCDWRPPASSIEKWHFVAHAPMNCIRCVRCVRRHFWIFRALPRVFNWAIDTFLSYVLERNETVWQGYHHFQLCGYSWSLWALRMRIFQWSKCKVNTEKGGKLEVWDLNYDNQDVHTRLQIFKVSLKMLMSYFYESRSGLWRRSWDMRYDNRR